MFFSGIADEAGKPLDVQIRAHRELGWRHIEVRNVNDTTLAYASDEEFARIHDQLNAAGMKVSCFASQIANWSRDILGPFEKDADELKRAIPRMRKMGTPFIRIMSYANKSNVSEAEWHREAIRRLREMARMAQDGGVALVHENCDGWGGLGPRQTLELVAEADSPALKLVFDTGNTIHHGQNSWDYYRQVKAHIVYVHIKDGRKEKEKISHTFPGEGDCDVKRILDDLRKWYKGGFSIEPHMAAVVHEGTTSAPEVLYKTYVEYGRRLVKLAKA